MTDDCFIYYKTHTIRLMSYRRDEQWVPHALVSPSGCSEDDSYPVSDDATRPTKDAADEVAKKLAIERIDSGLPADR